MLLVGYFVVGLPAGAYLAFATPPWRQPSHHGGGLGLLGLWLGMTIAIVIHTGSYLLVCFAPCRLPGAIRWKAAVEQAKRRLHETDATMAAPSADAACAPLPPMNSDVIVARDRQDSVAGFVEAD